MNGKSIPGTPTSPRYDLLCALCCFLGPNIIFGLLAQWYVLYRPIFNLDYIFPTVLLATRFRHLGFVAFSIIFVLDALLSLSAIFFNAGEYITFRLIWEGILQLKVGILITVVAAIPLGLLFLDRWLVRFGRPSLKRTALFSGLFVFIIAAADILNGSSVLWWPGQLVWNVDIAYSSLARITRRSLTSKGDFSAEALPPNRAASGRYLLHSDSRKAVVPLPEVLAQVTARLRQEKRNVLFVVMESLGSLRSDAVRGELFAPLSKLNDRYQVDTGIISTYGGTVSGELRELCWLQVDKIDLSGFGATRLNWSIPKLYAAAGYETESIHGFSEAMFVRKTWYPAIGFAKSIFLEQMLAADPEVPRTGVFHYGASDVYAIREVKARIVAHRQPFFIYWLTLTGHLPVNIPYAQEYANDVRYAYERTAPLPEVIQHHETINKILVLKLAELAAEPALPPFDIVLVGDHPPKFWTDELRDKYMESSVPYIILRRRP